MAIRARKASLLLVALLSLGFLSHLPAPENVRRLSSCVDPAAGAVVVPPFDLDFMTGVQSAGLFQFDQSFQMFVQQMQLQAEIRRLEFQIRYGLPAPVYPSYALPRPARLDYAKPADAGPQIFGGLSQRPDLKYLTTFGAPIPPGPGSSAASIRAAAALPRITTGATLVIGSPDLTGARF